MIETYLPIHILSYMQTVSVKYPVIYAACMLPFTYFEGENENIYLFTLRILTWLPCTEFMCADDRHVPMVSSAAGRRGPLCRRPRHLAVDTSPGRRHT